MYRKLIRKLISKLIFVLFKKIFSKLSLPFEEGSTLYFILSAPFLFIQATLGLLLKDWHPLLKSKLHNF